MRAPAPSTLLLASLLLFTGCPKDSDDKDGPSTSDSVTTDTDRDTQESDASDTEPGDSDPSETDPNETDPNGTDPNGTDPNDTDLGRLIGCTGASGQCAGLQGDSCLISRSLGCDVEVTVTCNQQVYCVTVLDGCPPAFCSGSGETCAWRDPADQAEAQSCRQNTTMDSCRSVLCRPFNPVCTSSGTWSCDSLRTQDTGGNTSDPAVCDAFDAYGFDCDPLYE